MPTSLDFSETWDVNGNEASRKLKNMKRDAGRFKLFFVIFTIRRIFTAHELVNFVMKFV